MSGEYKVDETRGSSMINPLNYKGDVLVQVWCDSRVLATLLRWMDEHGNHPRYMSQVVRRPLELIADLLTSNGEVLMVDDTSTARAMLEHRFGVNLNRGDRGKKNVLHNQVLSARRGELADRMGEKADDVSTPLSGGLDERVKEAMKLINEVEISDALKEDDD